MEYGVLRGRRNGNEVWPLGPFENPGACPATDKRSEQPRSTKIDAALSLRASFLVEVCRKEFGRAAPGKLGKIGPIKLASVRSEAVIGAFIHE